MSETVPLEEFLKKPGVIFDVRSPAEYAHSRIPGSVNMPLFSDQERAAVGTAYKRQGKEQAIELGLRIAGPKLADFVLHARGLINDGIAKVHCWRGGMRSAAMAWLLNFAGMRTAVLRGGYKVFRRWVLRQFDQSYPLIVLGGMTGCGKTSILEALKTLNEQVLDLESCAGHRGSSYGIIGMGAQPSTEQFENEVAIRLAAFDIKRSIWIEDESRQIGACNIPGPFFDQMRRAPLAVVDMPVEERLERLMAEYGHAPAELLIAATKRIGKRLGSQRTKEIVDNIGEGHMQDAIANVLRYYDSAYSYGLALRTQANIKLTERGLAPEGWAKLLLCTFSDQKKYI